MPVSIYGRAGVIVGTDLADTLDGGEGPATISALAGNDVVWAASGPSLLRGQDGDDSLLGGGANDTLLGGEGQDFLWDMGGDDIIRGGAGSDTLIYLQLDQGIAADLAAGTVGGNGADEVHGIERLWSTNQADTLRGSGADEFLWTWGGNDFADGRGGDDTLLGGTGSDYGRDTLCGGSGADFLNGDEGDDSLLGGAGNDRVFGSQGSDTMRGGAGDDYLFSFPGGYYGEGETLIGGSGDDTLLGGEAFELLAGGSGADTIYGGANPDTLYGGSGCDSFRFSYVGDSDAYDPDRVRDLSAEDWIDLTLLDADITASGRQAARLIQGAFTGSAGEMHLVLGSRGQRTLLEIDVDGDFSPDFALALKGDHTGFTNILT